MHENAVTMRIIELDASGLRDVLDFTRALCALLGSPGWHGQSIDAFIDSMVWGGIDKAEPPYMVRIVNTAGLTAETRDWIETLRVELIDSCAEYKEREGEEISVGIEIVE